MHTRHKNYRKESSTQPVLITPVISNQKTPNQPKITGAMKKAGTTDKEKTVQQEVDKQKEKKEDKQVEKQMEKNIEKKEDRQEEKQEEKQKEKQEEKQKKKQEEEQEKKQVEKQGEKSQQVGAVVSSGKTPKKEVVEIEDETGKVTGFRELDKISRKRKYVATIRRFTQGVIPVLILLSDLIHGMQS